MTTRRRGPSTRSRRGPKPRYLWQDRANATATAIAAGGTALIDLLENTDQAVRTGATVVRMLLKLTTWETSSANEIEWHHGVLVVTRDAFLAGAVPEPATDRSQWYLQDAGFFRGATERTSHEDKYDIRTARKLNFGLDSILLHVMENTGATSLTFYISSRILLRLP